MKMKKFNTNQSDLSQYNNMKCEIIRPLTDKECDIADVGNMYKIKLENGIEIDAFEDELSWYTILKNKNKFKGVMAGRKRKECVICGMNTAVKCKKCGKDFCLRHIYQYVDESNIAITKNSPLLCAEYY